MGAFHGWLGALVLGLAVAVAAAEKLPDFDRLWDYAHPDKTEAAFRALLPKAQDAGNVAYQAELLTQIARTQGLQRHFEEAHRTLDQVKSLLAPEHKVAHVRYLLERGRVFNSSGKVAEARPLFREAWEAAQAAKLERLALDAAHMLGIVEEGDEGLRWNEKAIALAEKSDSPAAKGWLGPLYNNTGWTYYDRGAYEKALGLLRKAEAVYRQRGNPVQIRIARYSVAKTLRALGKVTEALAIQEVLRKETEAAKDPDGYVYEELGECLLALKRPDEARPYFGQAYDLLSQDPDLPGTEPKRLERLKKLAGR